MGRNILDISSSNNFMITGASRGIGRELVRALISMGHRVFVVSRSEEDLNSLSAEIDSDKLFVFPGDISDKESIEHAYSNILRHAGHIDVLINNAGVDPISSFHSLTWSEIETTINTNLKGHIYLTLLVVRGMMAKERRGHIVNISSIMGLIPLQNEVIYCATKFGLRGFSLSLRTELKKHNIGVSVICPPAVRDVGMVAESWGLEKKPFLLDTIPPNILIDSVIKSIKRNKRLVIPGFGLSKLGLALYFISPRIYEFSVKITGVGRYMDTVAEKRIKSDS